MSATSVVDVQPEFTEVLIIGAGPSGLMGALALGGLGVKTILVDRRAPGTIYGSADGIQPATIEMWESYGLKERLFQDGHKITTYAAYTTNEAGLLERQPQGFDIDVPDARYPFEVAIPTEALEGVVRDAAAKSGVPVQWTWIPTSIVTEEKDGDEYPVKVALQHPTDASKTRVIHAKYVIGSDGARSWVRSNVRIDMVKAESDDEAITFGVVNFTPDTDIPDMTTKTVITTPICGTIGYISHPDGKGRLYIPLLPTVDTRKIKEEELLAIMQETLDKSCKPYYVKITEPTWVSTYRVVQSVAARFAVKDRVFISGDAAHTHSAKAGQGANASMRDTHNLAWKIAYVLRGWASPSLLATYDLERRTYAQALIALDKDIAKAFDGGKGDYKKIWDDKNRFISGVGVVYDSSLTPSSTPSQLAPNITPGERLPPVAILRLSDWHPANVHDLIKSDGTFKLVFFPGTAAASREKLPGFVERFSNELVQGGKPKEMVKTSTVIQGAKANVHWTDVPEVVRDRFTCVPFSVS
ncbi:FAD binding domain-containing protein [Amylostereum chailletii]|nr:FAD binding domain-containing protein [Amylostereum chailletii]